MIRRRRIEPRDTRELVTLKSQGKMVTIPCERYKAEGAVPMMTRHDARPAWVRELVHQHNDYVVMRAIADFGQNEQAVKDYLGRRR